MSTITRLLIPAKDAAATDTTQYTVPSGSKVVLDKFTATNVTAGAITFSVNLVASGGSAGTTNLIIDAKNIAAHETYTCPELSGQVIESGGFISTIAGSAASITITASGREIVQ